MVVTEDNKQSIKRAIGKKQQLEIGQLANGNLITTPENTTMITCTHQRLAQLRRRQSAGFSLTELTIAVAIASTMMAFATPRYLGQIRSNCQKGVTASMLQEGRPRTEQEEMKSPNLTKLVLVN